METDAQQASYTGQQSDRFTAPPESESNSKSTPAASSGKKHTSSRKTAQAALAEERRKAAEVQVALLVAGITDHITPWQGCYATTQLLGGKVTFILSNSGHIQALLNPPGNPKSSYFINARYPADPEQWLAGSKRQPGSWWGDWHEWMTQRAGEQKPAPQVLGNKQYQPSQPAPGTYVFEP